MCFEWTFSTTNIEEIFGERSKVTRKSKLSRPVLTYGQRLEVHTMDGCILQSSVALSFGCKIRKGSKKDPIKSTNPSFRLWFEVPLRVETVNLVCLQGQCMAQYPIKISDENSKNSGFY